MSSRKSKRNKNNSDNKNQKMKNMKNPKNNESDIKNGKNGGKNSKNKADSEQRSTITFKFPGRWATLSCLVPFNDSLTCKELLRKVRLSVHNSPPEAQKLFELYFMDEIYPFISKHAQDTVNTKKDIGKAWNLQTNDFQGMYNNRADVLRNRWMEMRGGGNNNSNNSHNSTHHTSNSTHSRSIDSGSGNDNTANSQTVIFKYYSVHSSAKTNRHIIIRQPNRQELINKIKLSKSVNPPTAKQLFEIYYYDEILPFLKKSGQQSIRGKKDLSKVWQIQTKTFKNLYEDRARILSQEWVKLKKVKGKTHKTPFASDMNNTNTITNTHSQSQSQSQAPQTSTSTHNNYKSSQILNGSHNINHSHNHNHNINHALNSKSTLHNALEKIMKYKKMDCRLIRTLLNFSLFLECTTKRNCFMILVSNQNERYGQYEKYRNYISDKKDAVMKELCYIHLRVFISNFESESLRLHTSNSMVKLCFINPISGDKEKELIIFQLRFNKLLPFLCTESKLNTKIDDKNIEANIDEENKILSINIPVN